MPCSITVNSVVYNSGTLYISGTVNGCPGSTVNISGTCGSTPFTGSGTQVTPTITWNAAIPVTCSCGGSISFTATCSTIPTCTVTYTFANLFFCPTINILSNHLGQCNNAGTQQSVDIYIGYVRTPAGCPFVVEINWGDGSPVQTVTLTNVTPNAYQINHYYNIGGTYTATVSIVSPFGCPADTQTTTFGVPSPCPNCSSFSFFRFLCKLFEYIFVFSSVMALVLAASICGVSFVIPFLIALGISLLFIILICRQCLCGPIPKLTGEILFSMGITLLMFLLPPRGSCFPVQAVLNLLTAFSLLIGILLLIYWYNTNKISCPLTIC